MSLTPVQYHILIIHRITFAIVRLYPTGTTLEIFIWKMLLQGDTPPDTCRRTGFQLVTVNHVIIFVVLWNASLWSDHTFKKGQSFTSLPLSIIYLQTNWAQLSQKIPIKLTCHVKNHMIRMKSRDQFFHVLCQGQSDDWAQVSVSLWNYSI